MHWAPRPPWPGGDGRFTARYWDLQVPRSPGGAFLEAAHPLRTCKRLLGAAAAGVGWALAGELGASAEAPPRHSFAAPRLAFYLLLTLLRSGGMGRRDPGSAPGLARPPPHPAASKGPRARAAAPSLGRFPYRAGCRPGTSPPALHFMPGLVK